MTPARLQGPRVCLRPLDAGDRPALATILAEPAVARWWGQSGFDQAMDDIYGPWAHEPFAIEVDGKVAGYLQVAEELDPDYRHASIDLFLGVAWQGRGLGPEAIRLICRHLFEERGHHRLTIDPAVSNERAIRAYERVGFRPVGVMRNYERAADGTWHDGLLMDLLAGELLG
ncbi:MAG: aminoglycoside 6'-N-acetyltransferase [Chloroflexi bacterium]|nr:aminoglycoside 6'-N-acetyltransferase [Chloroflexota bacterium]